MRSTAPLPRSRLSDALGGPRAPLPAKAIPDDLARNDDSGRYLRTAVGSHYRWHPDCGGERDLLSGASPIRPRIEVAYSREAILATTLELSHISR
jgi:hypothetical protein